MCLKHLAMMTSESLPSQHQIYTESTKTKESASASSTTTLYSSTILNHHQKFVTTTTRIRKKLYSCIQSSITMSSSSTSSSYSSSTTTATASTSKLSSSMSSSFSSSSATSATSSSNPHHHHRCRRKSTNETPNNNNNSNNSSQNNIETIIVECNSSDSDSISSPQQPPRPQSPYQRKSQSTTPEPLATTPQTPTTFLNQKTFHINNNNMKNSDRISEIYSRQLSSSSNKNFVNKQSTASSSSTGIRKASLDHAFYDNNISTSPSTQAIVQFDSDNDGSPPSTPSSTIHPVMKANNHHHARLIEPVTKSRARMISSSDGFKAQKSSIANQEMRTIMSNDSKIAEKSSMSAMKAKIESNGFSAAKMMAAKEDQRQIQFGDTVLKHQSSSKSSSASMTMSSSTDNNLATAAAAAATSTTSSSSLSSSFQQQQQQQHQTATGMITGRKSSSQQQFLSASSKLNELIQSMSPQMLTFTSEVDMDFDELSSIAKTFKSPIISKTESINMKGSMNKLENKMQNLCQEFVQNRDDLNLLLMMTDMIKKAWSVPQCGYDLGFNMSRTIRETGALEALLCNIETNDEWKVSFASAQLLEQCLTADNRDYVVEHGLEKVVCIAKECVNKKQPEEVQVGVGILEHLFKHSENTCKEVIKLNGLETILYECRSTDNITLRHCASALTNLSLYGGPDSQESMIKLKAAMWLFPLAFHNDDNIKYYACLAITVLVANQELEAEVIKSGTLDLCEPFVLSHNPEEFAKSSTAHIHGQSKHWLARLVPVLMSKREEARCLASFHFAMEAWIKKTQEQTEVFKEIKAIEPLKKVASCPNAIASKYAAQALRTIGEEVPHKLSQQVPLWAMEDAKEWVKQIGFKQYVLEFEKSRVDGDILLKLNEEMLRDDIGIKNGILRKRFIRELDNLKIITDYSSCDPTKLAHLLGSLGQDYIKYCYAMLNAAIDRNTLPLHVVTDDMLLNECHIYNTIHRLRILELAENLKKESHVVENNKDNDSTKTLDVFISYRRSNGSQLASLLKVHLQLRGFSVFLDVERLEAGKFDNNLLNSIRQAKHFLLVLTANALDRCLHDDEQKDWVHREIAQALQTKCNIIPIMESFQWPNTEDLPEDIRPICHFNGIRWIHDYQEACVDKLERFMRGEYSNSRTGGGGVGGGGSDVGSRYGSTTGLPPHGLPPTPTPTGGIRSPSQQRRSCSVDNVRHHDN